MSMSRGWIVGLSVVVVALGANAARGDELKSKLANKLEEIGFRRMVEDMGETAVAVGDFTLKARLNASGGIAISKTVVEAVQDLGLAVNTRARLEVAGKVSQGEVNGLSSLKVQATVEDTKNDRVVLEFQLDLADAATIMRIAGGTGDISGRNRQEQSGKVDKILRDPSVHISDGTAPNSRVAASADGRYAIELLVKAGEGDYRARSAANDNGQAVVPLRASDVYAVRLINASDRDAAVVLALDGLSMFAFSDAPAERESRIIVPKGGEALITGWYRNAGAQGSNEFLVTKLAEAAVARLLPPSPARVGMVTAEFAVAWPRSEPIPPGEVVDLTKDDGVGTAIGKPIDQPFTRVDYLFGKPKAAVTIRYDKPVGGGR